MLMELIHFSGVRPLPSFSSSPLHHHHRRATPSISGSCSTAGRGAPGSGFEPSTLPQGPESAALPIPHPLSPGQGSPASTFSVFLSRVFPPSAFCQEFSCSPARRTSGTSAESMLNDLLKRVRMKKSIKKKREDPTLTVNKGGAAAANWEKQTGPQLHLTCLGWGGVTGGLCNSILLPLPHRSHPISSPFPLRPPCQSPIKHPAQTAGR